MSLSAVCPLITTDLGRFKLLVASLDKFALEPIFDEFWCCVADPSISSELAEIDTWKFCRTPIQFIDDDELVEPGLIKTGWYKQQVIKLLLAERVTTDFYCVFDADVLCCRPLTRSMLIDERGRAVLQYDRQDGQVLWMKNACRLLGYEPDASTEWMDVTPAILSTTLTRQLCQDIGLQRLIHWISVELTSEYSLYYINLISKGLFETYHFVGRLISDQAVWFFPEVFTWSFGKELEKGDAPFTLYQSNIKISDVCVRASVRPYLFPDSKFPLIRCVLRLTRVDRLGLSIGSFLEQTYPNTELYILTELELVMETSSRIPVCREEPTQTVGTLTAEWNEMTLYHPTRLEAQYNLMMDRGWDECRLGRQMVYLPSMGILKVSPVSEVGFACLSRSNSSGSPKCLDGGLHILSIYIADGTDDPYIQTIAGRTWEPYQFHVLYREPERKRVQTRVEELLDTCRRRQLSEHDVKAIGLNDQTVK